MLSRNEIRYPSMNTGMEPNFWKGDVFGDISHFFLGINKSASGFVHKAPFIYLFLDLPLNFSYLNTGINSAWCASRT